MDSKKLDIFLIYQRLFDHFGHQGWWPVYFGGDPRLEICIGAILTQNTAWTNVEIALINLDRQHLLTVEKLLAADLETIGQAVRSAGYFHQKAKKINQFVRFIAGEGGFDSLFRLPVRPLRAKLLEVWGIGRETADSMILYAAKKPIFVVDTYTKRLLSCFQIEFQNYDEYRIFFEHNLPRRAALWNEYHALIVAWGKLQAKNQDQARQIINVKRRVSTTRRFKVRQLS
ncbi:hypothetical protein HY628_02515 [Candidatus Uhrbacteria bacterium]|nr:hypothetical protein [Candidatus Uhrbacteria bacterium]